MSEAPKSSYLNLSNLDAEFTRTLNLIIEDQKEEETPTSTAELNLLLQSPALAHEAMAEVFINYDVSENKRATERAIKKMLEDDKREAERVKKETEKSERMVLIESAYEVFDGRYTRAQITQFMKDHDFNIDRVLQEMAEASIVGANKDFSGCVPSPKTVFASKERILFNNSSKNSPPSSPCREHEPKSIDEAIQCANEYANELRDIAKHREQRAYHHGVKDYRFGPLMAIARDDKQKADKIQDDADALQATKIGRTLDLHGFQVRRALRMVHHAINVIVKRPYQAKLEVVTGRGNNSIGGRGIMKEAVMQFCKKMNIRFEVPVDNPGALVISVPHSAI